MYFLLRYILLFLISLLILSKTRNNIQYLSDLSSFEIWGNKAEIHIEVGQPSISMEGRLGAGGVFLMPSGENYFFCVGDCILRISLPEDSSIDISVDQAELYAQRISSLEVQLRHGQIFLSDVQQAKVSLFDGYVNAMVPPNGNLHLLGHRLNGDIFSLGDGFFHRITKKGEKMEEENEGSTSTMINIQYFDGNISVLRDSLVKDFESY